MAVPILESTKDVSGVFLKIAKHSSKAMHKAITNGKTDILKWYYFENSTNVLNKNNNNYKTYL